jgi:hypothetical protein
MCRVFLGAGFIRAHRFRAEESQMLMPSNGKLLIGTMAFAVVATAAFADPPPDFGTVLGGEDAPTCEITDLTDSTACAGAIAGNISDFNDGSVKALNLFGIDDWVEVMKVESWGGTDNSGSDTLHDDEASPKLIVTAGSDLKSETWSIEPNIYSSTVKSVMAVLKSATNFAAYRLDNTEYAEVDGKISGTWDTTALFNNGGGERPELSNFTIWTSNKPDTPFGTIPLPAGAWFMIAAFGSLGAAREIKRRRKA